MKRPLLLCAFLLLAGCASSPKTHFFTLSVRPGGQRGISVPVQLAAVHLPPTLDRLQMVWLSGENSVQISETNRWSAPIDEMVRNVLSQDLAARLSPGKLILPDAPAPLGTRRIVVTLAQFGRRANGEVTLSGSWALLGPDSDLPLLERTVDLETGPAANPEAVAAVMSALLGELAGKIVAGMAARD